MVQNGCFFSTFVAKEPVRDSEMEIKCLPRWDAHTEKFPVECSFYLPIIQGLHLGQTPFSEPSFDVSEIQRSDIGCCIKVHEDHRLGDSSLDLPKTIHLLVESWHFVKFWCFDQFAFSVVAPTVVPTPKHCRAAGFFLGYSICSVPAYVVECTELFVFSENDNERESSDLESSIVARLLESARMGHE